MVAGGFPLSSSLMFLVTLNIGATFGALGWLARRSLGLQAHVDTVLSAGGDLTLHAGYQAWPAVAQRYVADRRCHHHRHPGRHPRLRCTAVPERDPCDGRELVFGNWPFGAVAGPAMGGLMLSINLPLQINFILCAVPGLVAIFAIAMIKEGPLPAGLECPAGRHPSLNNVPNADKGRYSVSQVNHTPYRDLHRCRLPAHGVKAVRRNHRRSAIRTTEKPCCRSRAGYPR